MKINAFLKHKTSLIIFFLYLGAFANNLQIENLQIASVNSEDQYAMIQFDVSWENSWRDASNYDAVWVFIKYRQSSDADVWYHATLDISNHFAPAGSIIDASIDGKGTFVYRNNISSGNSDFNGFQIRWNYGVDGVVITEALDIKIFGIEMVYVPEGSFYVGDGQTDGSNLYANFELSNTGSPFEITSENSIVLGGSLAGSLGNNNQQNQFVNGVLPNTTNCSGDGCLIGSGDDFNDITSQTLPSAFPKGFNAFYCMKYEITQQQYVDMLNTLTTVQQTTYLTQTTNFVYSGALTASRYGIQEVGGVYSTLEPNVPMIFFDWIKSAAYADWAALRPMTELEFEKACRGTQVPVINEFAWGNSNLDVSNNFTLNNVSLANEAIVLGFDNGGINGNAWIRVGSQTMMNLTRVGIFSAHPNNTGRISSGSSFWGIQELSGHAWERAVSVGHTEGRKFTGIHGDGILNNEGYANVLNWPGTFADNIVNTNIGVGYRGGALAYPNPNIDRNARVSSRRIASGYWDIVINDDGARLVRTAQ